MPTFDDLPTEVRCLIYEHLFAGQRLTHYPPLLQNTQSATRKARKHTQLPITSILYVCRKSLHEAMHVFLKTAIIHLPELANTLTVTHECIIDDDFSSTIAHVRLAVPSGGTVRNTIPAMSRVLDVMPNLKTMELRVRPGRYVHWDADWLGRRIAGSNFEKMTWLQRVGFAMALLDDAADGYSTHQIHS